MILFYELGQQIIIKILATEKSSILRANFLHLPIRLHIRLLAVTLKSL